MKEHLPQIPSADVLVVGSGPNGLAAAVEAAGRGLKVVVIEREKTPGGGVRSAELTLPGFIHDICAAVHPLGVGSPFFRSLPLEAHGLEWVHPDFPLAHPFDDGTAAVLARSCEDTAGTLGEDGARWRRLMEPLASRWDELGEEILAPIHIPRHPLLLARFGLPAILSARALADLFFDGKRGRGLFAGLAAHSFLPLERPLSGAFGVVLGVLGHAVGWPFPRGGAGKIPAALVSLLRSLGGEVVTGIDVASLEVLPPARGVFLDVTPRQLVEMAGARLSRFRRRRLLSYRYGPGVFKADWALSGPIPWKARECFRAGTVHIGGTFEEIAQGEGEVWNGMHPERPFVLLAQQSLFDASRAPEGKHTAWGYCHVPNASSFDMTERIESQIERFAPGFRDLILARHVRSAAAYELYNPNFIGGDINGGVQDLPQFLGRPLLTFSPYSSGIPGVWLCSASTPPGGGVHGMAGSHAVRRALR